MISNPLRGRRGFTSISVLILFIATIVMGLIITSYFIVVTDKLAGKATTSKQEIDRNFKAIQILEVTGFDATTEHINHLMVDIKLYDETGQLNLNELSVIIGEPEFRSLLTYRPHGQIENSHRGYETYSPQEFGMISVATKSLSWDVGVIHPSVPYELPIDLDNDNQTDYVYTCDDDGPCPISYGGTHLRFDLSSTSGYEYAELRSDSTGQLLNVSDIPVNLDVTKSPISGGYGYISLAGLVTVADQIDVDVSVFKMPQLIRADLDNDGENDTIYLNDTHAIINVSGADTEFAIALGENINASPATLDVDYDFGDQERYGTLTISGTTTSPGIIDPDMTFLLTPYNKGGGYFVAEYLRRGNQHVDDGVVPGDMVRLYMETYDDLVVGEVFEIKLLYKDTDYSSKGLYVGDTMPNKYYVTLFPRP